jgi:Toprim domain
MTTQNEGTAAMPRDEPLDDLPAGRRIDPSPENGIRTKNATPAYSGRPVAGRHRAPDASQLSHSEVSAMSISYDELAALAGQQPMIDVACPLCGPSRRAPANRKRKTLRIWHGEPGFATFCCRRCGERGFARANEPPGSPRTAKATPSRVITAEDDTAQQARIEIALKIFEESVPLRTCPTNRGEPSFTLGWKYYVQRRGLHIGLLDDDLTHALRWHQGIGAVVALMTDPATGKATGIQRTFLNADGTKRERKMLGRQGVIRLSKVAGAQLGITEGIEDGLAVLLSDFSPVWAATSAGAIERFPVIPGVKHLLVFGDNDEVGRRAAHRVAYRYRSAHNRADLRFPAGAKDWADSLKRAAA